MVVAIPPRNRSWEHVTADQNSHPSPDGLGGRHHAPTLHALCSPGFPVVVAQCGWETGAEAAAIARGLTTHYRIRSSQPGSSWL